MPVVLTEKHSPHITIVTLNRPERRNALSIQLLTELISAIKLASDQPHDRRDGLDLLYDAAHAVLH